MPSSIAFSTNTPPLKGSKQKDYMKKKKPEDYIINNIKLYVDMLFYQNESTKPNISTCNIIAHIVHTLYNINKNIAILKYDSNTITNKSRIRILEENIMTDLLKYIINNYFYKIKP